MPLPVQPNTTCDIYRNANAPPAAPDVAGVACHLTPHFHGGQEAGERDADTLVWTHLLLVDVAVDIRDPYAGQMVFSASVADYVWVPDQNGTEFAVTFVERVGYGTPHDHKRVYLDRRQPSWPTNNL